ncbi:MAG: tRNA preQ1(34) S-adenosylmethionine ribosyltransferase-isomerase QueA [Gaiellales bacterium]|nr:MAG: tRNA preQ1(34) S-adenosylmethionine ribosyltransferase-isomerase QueA [Gaiellales bacterium]
MLTDELDYDLPPELIAQHPVYPRDHSRLLVYDRGTDAITHRSLPDLLAYLDPGDALVYNDSRVLMARVAAVRPTGGRTELLFLRRRHPRVWEALARPSARLREGMSLSLEQSIPLVKGIEARDIFTLMENLGGGRWLVENRSGKPMEELLEEVGRAPLPPYIREELGDPGRYQTVYAREHGSAAAPTAGLHFTPELIASIEGAGVAVLPLTLHVGLDTFRPVAEHDLELHEIHREYYRVPAATRDGVESARAAGGKVVAVGTTTVRGLETVFQDPGAPLEGDTSLFILPGFRFRAVDALMTNFHLPRSTLLALVMAFAGVAETRRLYSEAIRQSYRFYSFGDAMLML